MKNNKGTRSINKITALPENPNVLAWRLKDEYLNKAIEIAEVIGLKDSEEVIKLAKSLEKYYPTSKRIIAYTKHQTSRK